MEILEELEASLRNMLNTILEIVVDDKLWEMIWRSLWDGDYFLEFNDCEDRLERLIDIYKGLKAIDRG